MDGHRAALRAGMEAGKQLPYSEGTDVFLKIKALGLSLAVYRDASQIFIFIFGKSIRWSRALELVRGAQVTSRPGW